MRLASLTLQGFKSFGNRTTIEFDPGVTAIIGPNGSGKSNVIDALKWTSGGRGRKRSERGSVLARPHPAAVGPLLHTHQPGVPLAA